MFLFKSKEEIHITIRNEWGVLTDVVIPKDALRLTDEQLAAQLGVPVTTVETHRRD